MRRNMQFNAEHVDTPAARLASLEAKAQEPVAAATAVTSSTTTDATTHTNTTEDTSARKRARAK